MTDNARAILVHSNSILMESLEAPLKDLRITTATCETCEELAARVRELQPELVFTEAKVADGTWLEVVKMTSRASPPVNVLVVGAASDSRLQVFVRDCGGYAYLSPPYEWFPFQVTVRLALRDVEERRQELDRRSAA